MSSKGISIRRFVRLERQARAALKRGDRETLAQINLELAAANMRLFDRDGVLYVENIHSTKEA